MTPVDQEFVGKDVIGDCVRAATATILDLPITDVPHFVKDQPEADWVETWEAFMRKHGVEPIMVHGPWDAPPVPLGYYLASGPVPRGGKHMLVMHGGKVAHDPHPSREGLTEIEAVWIMGKVS